MRPRQTEPQNEFRNDGRKNRRTGPVIAVAFLTILIMAACGHAKKKESAYTDAQRLQLDTTMHTNNIDSLLKCVDRWRQAEDHGREMGALAALGHGYQTASRYSDAVKAHQKQLVIAQSMKDTLMEASALNDLGINYRRLGLYYNGLDYHLRAVEKTFDSENDPKLLKCRAIGYNGAGNVYLTIGNFQKANQMLRKALAVEKRLNSHLGMNVDLANIGTIFERRGMLDSAWVYFRESMKESKLAESTTGQAYGHMNYGRLYMKEGDYAKAMEEYRKSMDIVYKDRDRWLWMQPCIELAGAYIRVNQSDSARHYLELAMQTAQNIGAREYMPRIYNLYADYHEQKGDIRKALEAHRTAGERQDSLLGARNLFEIEALQNELYNRQQQQQEQELKSERKKKQIALAGAVLLSMMLAAMYYALRIRAKSHRQLAQTSTMREHFITNITHEFRTPLTVILGLSHDLKQDKAATPQNAEKAAVIERQGNNLLQLINQLLDISRIKSAVGNPDWQNGDITLYVAMIVDTYRDFAHARNIELQFFASEPIKTDFVPDYISKTMNNLLSNALKFTPKYGRINISLQRKGGNLIIEVADSGQGISQENIPHLFEPFYQADTAERHMGSGVGLALVKQIVDAVEGTIKVKSKAGQGSTFRITMPIRNKIRQQADIQTNIPMLPEEESRNATISERHAEEGAYQLLIVEDNKDVADYIGSQLDDRYVLSYANNGDDGLKKALESVPDLIITDLMMPGIDGLELCRKIRGNEVVSHIPVIIITAKASEEERIKGLQAGADAYLTKPFNSDELHTRVEKLLEKMQRIREKERDTLLKEEKEEGNTDTGEMAFITKVIDCVYLMMDEQKTDTTTVAETLCMSPRQFHRKLLALTGETPASFIQEIKIKRACQLLKSAPETSIVEVARKCGFDDGSNFTRTFKKVTGLTPTQYQKEETQGA